MPEAASTPENLASYLRRMREERKLSQAEVASKAGIHYQSYGKIERGETTRLSQKSLQGLAYALSAPVEYLMALAKGRPVVESETKKFCPHCWQPGQMAEPIWLDVRSKFCFMCGTALRDRCAKCDEPVVSLTFRFCPHCGHPYRED